MGWRLRLGQAMLAMLGGALLGWLLSLTQGSHVHHWPWIVVGAVLTLAVGLIAVEIIARFRHSTERDYTPAEPMHPGGVTIRAQQILNGPSGAILASGPGSFVDLGSDTVTNTGLIHQSHDGPGIKLADHLRLIAGHINSHASEWARRTGQPSPNGRFAEEYVRFGYGRQAAELYDSAINAGLKTDRARADFVRAVTPDQACQVSMQLARWAEELNQRSKRGPRGQWHTFFRRSQG